MPTKPNAAQQTIVRAPTTSRAMTAWTPDDLEVAEALTAGGHLQQAADVCWALLGDGRVTAALETRVKGLLRLPILWDKASNPAVLAALQDEGDWYAMHSEAALFSLFAWGILLGVGLAQRVWELRGDRWIGVLRPYDARYLRWDGERRVWVVRTRNGDVDIVKGDRRWVLYAPSCSGEPDGDERPWMYGKWRSCSRPWLGKYLAWGDWQGYNLACGIPIRTADLHEEKPPSKADREELADALLDAPASVVPPPGVKQLRYLEVAGATWSTFPASITEASTEIAISITGQSSSTEIVQGQDTGATLHGQVRRDLIGGDEQTGSTCLHDGSLEDYAEVNFGGRSEAPWARWDTTPPADAKGRGDAALALGNGLAALLAVVPEGYDREALVAAEFERAGFVLAEVPPVEGIDVNAPKDPAAALNGAQVSSLLEIVSQAALGAIPRETAVQLITAAFPLDEAKANAILGTVGQGFVPRESADGDPPAPATDPAARARGCGGSSTRPFTHERKIERPIAGARARPAFDPDNPLWAFRLDRGLDPAICDNVCDDHDGRIVRGDSDWWRSHTPPLHHRCHCFIEQLDGVDHDETPDDELPDTAKVSDGFGEGAIPLDRSDDSRARRLELRAQKLEIPPRMWGRPPRDGGTGRVYNPMSEDYARVVPKRSLEVGGVASGKWPGGWREWDESSPSDRRLAMLFIAALVLLALALDELTDRSPPTPGARRILDSERGRLRDVVVTENP